MNGSPDKAVQVPMRALLLSLALGILPATAEYVTLVTPNRSNTSGSPALSTMTITLAEGDTAIARYLSETAYLDVRIGGTLFRVGPNDPEFQHLPVIAGPSTIQLSNFSTLNSALGTIEVKRKGAVSSTPANIVVIPDDGSGDHEVTLESSTDMVTWTTTQAGVFNSSANQRFFRVRVKKSVE